MACCSQLLNSVQQHHPRTFPQTKLMVPHANGNLARGKLIRVPLLHCHSSGRFLILAPTANRQFNPSESLYCWKPDVGLGDLSLSLKAVDHWRD